MSRDDERSFYDVVMGGSSTAKERLWAFLVPHIPSAKDAGYISAELDAIEAEALNVERLARAMARIAEVGPPAHMNPNDAEDHWPSYLAEAQEYAREYAALAEKGA